MPVEVKNLRIKVNISGEMTPNSQNVAGKNWSSDEVVRAIEQVMKAKKER